jgi:RNA polymerase sigma-70 factor (ECF subfamily)
MAPDPDIAEMRLRTFLRLPSLQRSAVILKDALGHTIEEISPAIGVSEPAAKSALQRGRVRLRELAAELKTYQRLSYRMQCAFGSLYMSRVSR